MRKNKTIILRYGMTKLKLTFNQYNDKVVKCTMRDNNNMSTWVGIAKCNFKEGDKFNLNTGISIAFAKANKKRMEYSDKLLRKINTRINRENSEISNLYDKKLNNIESIVKKSNEKDK